MEYYEPYGDYEFDDSILDKFTPPEPPSKPQEHLMDKIGGRVWGLPVEKYPYCPGCKTPYTFIAQFMHHPPRMPLGRKGRVIFVFDCLNQETYCFAGSAKDTLDKTCFTLEPEELIDGLTPLPEPKNVLKAGLRIEGWRKKEDNLTFETYMRIPYGLDPYEISLEDNEIDRILYGEPGSPELQDVEELNYTNQTRLRSAPYFLQRPPDWVINYPKIGLGRWFFLGQLDALDDLFEMGFNTKFYKIWGGGIGYIFMRPPLDDNPPECKFFYQCT